MPTVPRYDTPQVSATVEPLARFDAPSMPDIAGRQLQQMGAGLQRAGGAMAAIATDAQNEANDLRVIDATNQAKERMFDLLYHKDTGALSQKGIQALERPDGKDLTTEYGDKFNEAVGEIAAGLGNDEQRLKFQRQAAAMHAQLYGATTHHLAGEFRTYQGSVYDGTIKTGQNDIALAGVSGNVIEVDPTTRKTNIDQAADTIRAAVKAKARLMGMSQTLADAEAEAAVSAGHEKAISGLLEQKNSTAALAYFGRYKESMTASDVLRVQTQLTNQVRANVIATTAARVDMELAPRFAPDDMARLTGIVMGMESGGRRFDASGNLLTSPKGAKGEMQVLDGTNKDPGFGVTPAKDDSPEERARVGRDYLAAMVKRYGRVDQALAAYNAGPGTVDAAIAKAKNPKNESGGDWFSMMPGETQAYVKKGMTAYGAGDGAAPKPTEREYVGALVSRLGPNADPEMVRMATDEGKRRYALLEADTKQREEAAITDVQRALLENGGNVNALPVSLLARVPPGKRPELEAYAGKVRNPATDTDWGRYAELNALRVSNPQAFASLDLTLQRPYLAQDQLKTLIDKQIELRDPNKQHQVRSFDQQLTEAHGIMDLTGNSKADDRAKFDDYVSQQVFAEQKARGRELTFEERDKIIKRSMLKTDAGWFGGGKRLYELAGTTKEKTAVPKITSDERQLIVARLAELRLPASEENIRQMFNNRYGIR